MCSGACAKLWDPRFVDGCKKILQTFEVNEQKHVKKTNICYFMARRALSDIIIVWSGNYSPIFSISYISHINTIPKNTPESWIKSFLYFIITEYTLIS